MSASILARASQFLDLCVAELMAVPIEQLERATQTYADFRAALKRRYNTYWAGWARWVDMQARSHLASGCRHRP